VGTIRVISVSTPQKPLTVALWLWLVAFLSGSRARRAWRTRSPLAFYLMAAAAMYVLSLGPRPTLFGEPIWYSPPFAWLLELPGFSSVRAPARFALPAVLCLAVAGALAFERIRVRLSERGRAAAAAIAIAGVCADGWIRDLPIVALPDPHTAAAALGNQPIVELPLGDTAGDLAVMYRSIYHRRPVVNGYSGFEPVHYRVLRHALQSHDQAALEPVAAHGPLAIVENGRVSTIPHHAFDDAPPHGASLRIDSVTVDGHPLDLAPITDGNRLTSWQSAANQQGTETMVVDMSAVRVVDAVVLRLGVFVDGYPRSLAIDVSEDRRAWTRAWTGRGAGKAVAAALRDPAAVPMTFGFAPVRARWVRLRQLGADPIARWTVADLTVHGR
jgi:hypothetical protein